MRRTALAALLLLTACGTPQQQCINGVTRDQRVIERLIQETEGNLARGYALRTVTVYETEWVDCSFESGDNPRHRVYRRCVDRFPITTREPVAINLDAEAAKLDSLQRKRASLAREAGPGILACRAQYPE